VVVSLLLAALLLDIDPAIPFAISLCILALCPLMYIIDQISTAVALANWAYWFLTIGVVVMFLDHVKARSQEEGDSGD
jgi:hypothetical protein